MKREKEKLNRHFNPEKYKMTCCPHCRGRGKSADDDEGVKVCSQCGGFGWVRKENKFLKGGAK